MSWHQQSRLEILEILHALLHLIRRRICEVVAANDGVDRAVIDGFSMPGNINEAGVTAASEDDQALACEDVTYGD